MEIRQGKNPEDFDIDQCFESGQSSSSVTKIIQKREFDEMVIVDTPGFNDANKEERTDFSTQAEIIEHLNRE